MLKKEHIVRLNDSTYYGNYKIEGESIDIQMKDSFFNIRSISGNLIKEGMLLSGLIDDQNTIAIQLERVGD